MFSWKKTAMFFTYYLVRISNSREFSMKALLRGTFLLRNRLVVAFGSLAAPPCCFWERIVDSLLNWRMVSASQGIIIICPFIGVEYFSLLVNCIRASGLTTRVTLIVARGHFFCNWSQRLCRDRLYHMGCAVSCSHFFIWGCIAFVLSHKLCCDVRNHCVILLGRPGAISAHNWTLIHLVTLEYLMFRWASVKSPMWIYAC